MGFLDDIKKGASDLGNSINSSVSGAQGAQRATNLLHDLGALTWAAKTGQAGPNDSEEWARIEAELTAMADGGQTVDVSLKTSATPPPPPPAAAAPAPPPPAAAAPAPPAPPAPPAAPAPPAPPAAEAPAEAPTPPAAEAPAPPAPPAAPAPAPAAPASGGSFTLDDL